MVGDLPDERDACVEALGTVLGVTDTLLLPQELGRGVAEADTEGEWEAVRTGVGDTLPVGVSTSDSVREGEAVGAAEAESAAEPEAGRPVSDTVPLEEREALPLTVPVRVPLPVPEVLALRLPVALTEAQPLAEAVPAPTVGLLLPQKVLLAVPARLRVLEALRLLLAQAVGRGVADRVAPAPVLLTVALGLLVTLPVAETLVVGEALPRALLLCPPEAVAAREGLGLSLGVWDTLALGLDGVLKEATPEPLQEGVKEPE